MHIEKSRKNFTQKKTGQFSNLVGFLSCNGTKEKQQNNKGFYNCTMLAFTRGRIFMHNQKPIIHHAPVRLCLAWFSVPKGLCWKHVGKWFNLALVCLYKKKGSVVAGRILHTLRIKNALPEPRVIFYLNR